MKEFLNESAVLTNKSIDNEGLSSLEHSIESWAKETKEYQTESIYDVPERYYINTLVILPVNVNTSFIYWEVNDNYIKSIYDGEFSNFVIKMFEKAGNSEHELISFIINGYIGKYYINYYAPNKAMFAVLGIFDKNGNFIPILKSNMIVTPNDAINVGDELWMSKMSDWIELIHASLEKLNIKSSASILKEMEMLRKKERLRIDIDTSELTSNISSGEFLGGASEFLGSSNFSSFTISSNSLYKKE